MSPTPVKARRKRVRRLAPHTHNPAYEQDKEIAQAVCQVVNEMVCQVAEEPYGDLTRKRPPFGNVLRKFVKDSVQVYQEKIAADFIQLMFKKVRQADEEEEIPYGITLVWGIVLAEIEKMEKREKMRVYQNQKAAKRRELRRMQLAEQARYFMQLVNDGREVEESDITEHEEEEENGRPVLPLFHNDTRLKEEEESSSDEGMEMTHWYQQSPRSDDSDWAVLPGAPTYRPIFGVPPHRPQQQQHMQRATPTQNYPIFSYPVGQNRGGRGRGVNRTPTLRGILYGNYGDRMPESSLHPSVTRVPSEQSRTTVEEIKSEFTVTPEMRALDKGERTEVLSTGGMRRGTGMRPRGGRGSRGGKVTVPRRSVPLTRKEWDEDAEEYQQRLMAETIETSGESGSQESQDSMMSTINDVVARVSSMSELDEKKKGGENGVKRGPGRPRSTATTEKRKAKESGSEESMRGRKKRREEGRKESAPTPSKVLKEEDEGIFWLSGALAAERDEANPRSEMDTGEKETISGESVSSTSSVMILEEDPSLQAIH